MSKNLEGQKFYYVSSPDFPFFPGTGGTEAFTFGHIRELRRRGADARIITVGQKSGDGRKLLPDIPFLDVKNEEGLSKLDATLIGMVDPFTVPTKHPAFIMAHVPPLATAYSLEKYEKAIEAGHTIIANSIYAKKLWAEALNVDTKRIPVVYPFAHPVFSGVSRPPKKIPVSRVLFAGRLHITKGIFLLLEALYHSELQKNYHFSVTTAQGHDKQGEEILRLLQAHPRITLEKARTSPSEMAALMSRYDIVVVPSNHIFWQEAFGMISVEAQHAGCRVVASDAGGLPETAAGGLHLFEPGNSLALATAISEARGAGPISPVTRKKAAQHFTLAQSVESLLRVIGLR